MIDRSLNAPGGSAIVPLPQDTAVSDFIELLKPRVMSLVVFTGFAGIMVAPGEIHPVIAAIAVLCIAVATGASGAINMWYEQDLDARMERTKNRPLPAGRMEPETALTFGVVLAGGSVIVMALGVNYAAAAVLALAIGFYVFIYTIWLKRRTPQNIVIGGAAGAFPPMIGWASVTGDISIGGIALFALIFMWTPPHFWALALYKCEEYEKAGVPMLPVVSGILETKKQILLYTLILLPVSLIPSCIGMASAYWGGLAAVMGISFVALAINVWFDSTSRAPRRMFRFSLLYLSVLFAALIIDSIIFQATAG
ncbi:MAG: Protoheme IX farnesyltransferase [Alphaproteobacteria bacterium MarineAlpha11_Bin1]|nr:MAG: Protoheme IX farnesyltransferase [Alphaproteobacteria bacterium MarineAlpha11_Bin1]